MGVNFKHRVLFILHTPPPVHGAAMVGKYIMESAAVNNSFDASYINLSTSGSMAEIGRAGLKKILTIFRLHVKVIRALRSKKNDLCYITLTAAGTGFYKDLMVVTLLKLFQKKIIYHFHNKGIAAKSKNPVNHLLYRFAFNNTKSILLSPCLYPDLKRYVPERNVYFCANGVPDVHALPRDTYSTAEKFAPCQILFLSNMVIEKGVLILLEACKKLQRKEILFECHFVGAWSDILEEEFSDLVNNAGLSENVFAHGPKSGEAKNAFFTNADIFVLPTFYHNECFPLVLLEAMSYALPIISTHEGGIPDIVIDNKTGFLVSRKEAGLLADKLQLLIQDADLRSKFGSAAKARFLDSYTLEKFEHNFVSTLKSAISDFSTS